LWLRPARRTKGGKLRARAVWIIIDGSRHIATGCLESEIALAEQRLTEYIGSKYRPARKERALNQIPLADVLSIYLDSKDPDGMQKKFRKRIDRLNEFFGKDTLDMINGDRCREYEKSRGKRGGARRDLEDFRAAINHHHSEGYHREVVKVVLPERGRARERWLTRSEAAKLLWAAWRKRELQVRHRGADKGRMLETDKRPLQHIARFILMGLYTGTRAGAIASASPVRGEGRSFVDLDRGIFYRRAEGARETNKRQPPVPIPPRLLAHMRRWHQKGIAINHFVEWNGKAVKSVKTGFATAVQLAGIDHASPHTLRHTGATWCMQGGAPIWEASGFLGMSEKTLRETYGHHHPDFMKGAIAAIGAKPKQQPKRNDALVIPLVKRSDGKEKDEKTQSNHGGARSRVRTCLRRPIPW
jgi:integrase